jgi:hypothetical protein
VKETSILISRVKEGERRRRTEGGGCTESRYRGVGVIIQGEISLTFLIIN